MRGAGGDAISGAPFGWCVYVCQCVCDSARAYGLTRDPAPAREPACDPALTREPTCGRPALGSPYSQPATLWAVGVVRRVIGAEPAAHVTS